MFTLKPLPKRHCKIIFKKTHQNSSSDKAELAGMVLVVDKHQPICVPSYKNQFPTNDPNND